MWRQEADRYGINTIILPLALDEISLGRVNRHCHSTQWRPVYLDEEGIVLVRRSPATEDLIRRFEVNCATAPVPRDPLPLNAASFSQWISAARVLSALGRNFEALSAADKAMTIFPGQANAHWYRGQILYALQRQAEAEQEWQRTLALAPREVEPWSPLLELQAHVWSSLAELYRRQDRVAEAIPALQTVIKLSSDPSLKLQSMANIRGPCTLRMARIPRPRSSGLPPWHSPLRKRASGFRSLICTSARGASRKRSTPRNRRFSLHGCGDEIARARQTRSDLSESPTTAASLTGARRRNNHRAA